MKLSFQKELPLLIIVLIPFAYLTYIWDTLPETVPLHWNLQGEVDRYGNKSELIWIPILLPLLIYATFLVIPFIDPKDKIKNMGNKYRSLKMLLTVFMSVLAVFILYAAKNQSLGNPNLIVLLMGILYIILGNYFKTIKANYFIGIKTPWTLENETVWNETHKMAGKMWFVGGLVIVLSSFVLGKEHNFTVFILITAIIAIIPIAYSYFKFKKVAKV